MKYTIENNYLHITVDTEISMEEIFDEFLLPKKQRYKYYTGNHISCAEEIIKKDCLFQVHDEIFIELMEERDQVYANDKPIEVVYEDDLLLLVNKGIHTIVHEDGVNLCDTLNNYVKAYYQKQGITAPVRPIHRLDKDTSGIVIYCKIPFFQPLLDAMLQEKKIQRIYLAIVKGELPQKEIIIQKPIGSDRHESKKMCISKNGSKAWTKVIRRKKLNDATLVQCQLRTGRTHQIRIHLASIGYPILSDSLYGTMDERIQRCALHAWMVKFIHPLTQKEVQLTCEMPQDMLQLLSNTN